MAGNDVDMREVTELIRLSGQGIGLLFKGVANVVEVSRLAVEQLKLATYFHRSASETNYNCLSLKTLNKRTGGDNAVITIPTEDPAKIAEFINSIKKNRIHAAMLPDLNVGDGFVQIAYDPKDAGMMKALIQRFDFETCKETSNDIKEENKAREFSWEEYAESADPKTKEDFIKDTIKDIKENQNNIPSKSQEIKLGESEESLGKVINIEKLKAKHNNPDYLEISFDKDAIVAETDKAYSIKIPNSYNPDIGTFECMAVPKKEVFVTNERYLTHIPKTGKTTVFSSNKDKRKKSNIELYKDYMGYKKLTKNNSVGLGLNKNSLKAKTK